MRETIRHDVILGVRRIRDAPASRRSFRPRLFEVILANGSTAEVSFATVDKLLDGARLPADFWATMNEVDAAFSEGDSRFVRHPSGERFVAVDPEHLVSIVQGILFQEDPIGINFETNIDEYRPEARMIVEDFGRVDSEAALLGAIHGIFVVMFDESSAGAPQRYGSIARQIWAVRRTTISGPNP